MPNEHGDSFRWYATEVVGELRRRLIEEGLRRPLGASMYSIRAEDVALERRGDGWAAVIRFRIVGDARRYGFAAVVAESSDPETPRLEPPEMNAQTVLIILDEAILTRGRAEPDDEGVVWLR